MTTGRDGDERGIFAALKNVSSLLLASAKTRLELLGNEIKEEKLRVLRLLVAVVGMSFCFLVALLLLLALLTLLFWESRIVVLSVLTLLFFASGLGFFVFLKRAAQRPEPIFAVSLAQLQEDIRELQALAGHETKPG